MAKNQFTDEVVRYIVPGFAELGFEKWRYDVDSYVSRKQEPVGFSRLWINFCTRYHPEYSFSFSLDLRIDKLEQVLNGFRRDLTNPKYNNTTTSLSVLETDFPDRKQEKHIFYTLDEAKKEMENVYSFFMDYGRAIIDQYSDLSNLEQLYNQPLVSKDVFRVKDLFSEATFLVLPGKRAMYGMLLAYMVGRDKQEIENLKNSYQSIMPIAFNSNYAFPNRFNELVSYLESEWKG